MRYRRRRKASLGRQSSTAGLPPAQTAAHHPRRSNAYAGFPSQYEEITDIGIAAPQTPSDAAVDNYEMPTIVPSAPLYHELNDPSLAAASGSAANAQSPVYNDRSTTLIDNPIYDAQQPSVTSSNVAETGDDVTDHTLIDNDLYERPGQGQGQGKPSSGSSDAVYNDKSTTLVDNPLYDVQQPSMTSSNVAETAGGDVTDQTLIDNDLYERTRQHQ